MPTQRELEIQLVQSAQQRGMTPDKIKEAVQAYRAQAGVAPSAPPVPTTAPVPQKSFGRKVADVFTGSTQKFGQTLGAAAGVATGATRQIDEAKMAEAESRFNLAKQLRTAGPEQATRIKSQLGQGTDVPTAVEAIPALKKTPKQVYGEALGVGLEATAGGLLGAGKAGVLGKAAVPVAAKTLGQAVGRGAAMGATYGGLSGLSTGLQEDKKLGGLAKSTAIGAGTGAAIGGAFSAIGYGVSKLHKVAPKAQSAAGKKSEDIYRKVLKMTPVEQAREKAQGKNTPRLLKELGVTGDMEKIAEKVQQTLDGKEDELTALLAKRAKQGAVVSVDDLEKAATKSLEKYRPHLSEYSNIKKKVEDILANARLNYGDIIGVDDANRIKRALWKDAYSVSGAEVVNDAVYEAGSAVRGLIEKAIPDRDVAGMNKGIGELVVAAKQIAKSATRLQSGKMSSRLGAIIGGVIGIPGGPYAAMGSAALGSQVDKLLLSNVPLRTEIAQLLAKMEGASPMLQKSLENQVLRLLERYGILEAAKQAAKTSR